MTTCETHCQQIASFFAERLNANVPSNETDLLETGILNSLGLVELLVYLETTFGMKILLEKIEFDNFRSIVNIAEFIENQNGSVSQAALKTAV